MRHKSHRPIASIMTEEGGKNAVNVNVLKYDPGEETRDQRRERAKCLPKKRIMLKVQHSGLGNRIIAMVSAALLAAQTKRVLDIRWMPTVDCGDKYENLFLAPYQSHQTSFRPILFSQVDTPDPTSSMALNQQFCELHFDQLVYKRTDEPYMQMNVLTDWALFKRVDTFCDVISLRSNVYFAHLLQNITVDHQKFHDKFPHPFQDISNFLFNPTRSITDQAKELLDKMRGPEGNILPWMSIQAREKFIVGPLDVRDNTIERSFKCANKLLKDGKINHVFFAADSEKLRRMARSYMDDPDLLVEIPENLQLSTKEKDVYGDNYDIRNAQGMHAAVLEWYFIGEADYCMSASIEHSTFSKTAIIRGRCKYISFYAEDNCDVESTQTQALTAPKSEKEFILQSDSITNKPPFVVPKVDRDLVWDSIKTYRATSVEECTWHQSKDRSYDAVNIFWVRGAKLGRDSADIEDGE